MTVDVLKRMERENDLARTIDEALGVWVKKNGNLTEDDLDEHVRRWVRFIPRQRRVFLLTQLIHEALKD